MRNLMTVILGKSPLRAVRGKFFVLYRLIVLEFFIICMLLL